MLTVINKAFHLELKLSTILLTFVYLFFFPGRHGNYLAKLQRNYFIKVLIDAYQRYYNLYWAKYAESIHWVKILVHVSQHLKVVRQVNRNAVWTKSDWIRQRSYAKDNPFTVFTGQWTSIEYFFSDLFIWPDFALIAIDFEVLFTL